MDLAKNISLFILMAIILLFLNNLYLTNILLSIVLSLSITFLLFPLIIGRKKFDVTSPLIITFMYLIFAYPAKFIAFRLGMPYLKEEFPNTLWNDALMTDLFFGLLLGVISFIISFNFTPSFILNLFGKLKFKFDTTLDSKLPFKIFTIYLIGILSFAVQLFLGFYSSFAAEGINFETRFNVIFANTAEYLWYGLLAGFLWITSKETKKSKFGVYSFSLMLLFSFLMGIFFLASKAYLIYPVLFFILALSINKVKIKMPILTSLFIVVVFFTFLLYHNTGIISKKHLVPVMLKQMNISQ